MEKLFGNVYLESSQVFELLAAMFRVQSHEQLMPKDIRIKNKVSEEFGNWVISVRSRMPEEMKNDLEVFFNIESFLGLSLYSLVWKYKKHKDIKEFINFYETQVTAREIVNYLLQTGYHDEEVDYNNIENISTLEEAADIIKRSSLQEQEKWKLLYLYNDAENTKQRLINLIKNFYERFFIEKIESIKEFNENSIKYAKQILMNSHRRISDILSIDYDYVKDIKEIILIPTYFYGNITTLSYSDNNVLAAIFGIDSFNTDSQQKETEIIEAFKCLADEKRIKIIQILKHNTYYGYEIAQKLNLANSTTSHHISYLMKYKIINSIREDNKIYYEVNKDRIKEILAEFEDLLTK